MKLCLTGSAGGHLTQLLQLQKFYKKYKRFFVTYKSPTTSKIEGEKVYHIQVPLRNPLLFLINFFQSLIVLLKEWPDIIITTGGGVSVATCLIGKILGKKVVCIESFSRVKRPSLVGRILYPFSDLFLVQWEELLEKYGSKAKYRGSVF